MNSIQYVQKVKDLLTAHKAIINIIGLEKAAGFPLNGLRKRLRGEVFFSPFEAARVVNVICAMNFEFSGLNLTASELKKLPGR